VQQVAKQLAVGQAARLDGLGQAQCRTPTGGMRRQQRVTRRVAHDRRKRSRRLGLRGDHLMLHRARGQLDTVPRHHVSGDQLRESQQRPAAQLRRRPGLQERPGEPVRGAHICVGEPGHGVTF
jgi:hypothetical protein